MSKESQPPALITAEKVREYFSKAQKIKKDEDENNIFDELKNAETYFKEANATIFNFGKNNFPDLKKRYDLVAKSGLNILEILKIQNREKVYSAFLAWLLDPDKGKEHGLGNKFLKEFMNMVCKHEEFKDVHLSETDFSNVEVNSEKETEEGTFDILINSENWLCIIENKLFSPEGTNQTNRYVTEADKIANKAGIKKERIILIFLTLKDKKPTDSKGRFKVIRYEELILPLENVLKSSAQELPSNARQIIELFKVSIEKQVIKLKLDKSRKDELPQISDKDFYLDNYELLKSLNIKNQGGKNE